MGQHHNNKVITDRGERLRQLRDALRLSRAKLANGIQVSMSTVQGWENARFGGLTEQGAQRLCDYFHSLGVVVSLEWLLYGVGEHPIEHGQQDAVAASHFNKPFNDEQAIFKELKLFQEHHHNSIDVIVSDNAMAPLVQKGDLVAGERLFGDDIKILHDEIIIAQLKNSEVLVRQLKVDEQGDCNLVTLDKSVPILKAVTFFSAAKVLWLRKFAG